MKSGFSIDRERPESLHWQIAESIRSQILDGSLRPGQRLPAIRELAKELGVHRITVFKAYQELTSTSLLEARTGSGTFVASEYSRKTATDLLGKLVFTGPMNRFEAVSDEAGIRSLATNAPDPWFFRADEFLFECYELRKASPWIFYYAPPAGAHELCRVLAGQLTARGLPTVDSQIIVTNGNTHSVTLALGLLTTPDIPVAIEDPMFLGAKSWFEQRGYRYLPIPSGEKGVDLDYLKHVLEQSRCKAFIVSPTFGQVTGRRMSEDERHCLVEVCGEFGCTIIEMASTAQLSFDGDPPPPLTAASQSGKVIYVDDFSSVLSPGLRVGFLRLHQEQAKAIETRLQNEQHSGVQFIQIALANFIERGLLKSHLERVIPKYKARRDRLVTSLRSWLPTGSVWTHPEGAFSTWVQLPKGPDYETLYHRALAKGVAIAPGRLFTDRPNAHDFMRLSYGTQEPPAIEEAIRILGEVVRECV